MLSKIPLLRLPFSLLLAAWLCHPAIAPAQTVNSIPLPGMPQNTRLMIWGDSITEIPAWYPRYEEGYLLMCTGRTDIKVCTAGHSGEQSGALVSRQSDLQAFNPTIVQFNWGMNDTGYSAYTTAKGQGFSSNTQASLALLKSKGITGIVAGPGNVDDTYSTTQSVTDAQNYCLQQFSILGNADAVAANEYDADVFDRMQSCYLAAEAVYGPTYGYGVHQSPTGAILMVYEMLKTLGCSGTIGNINVDMNGGATATAGHTVVSASNGVVTLDSTTYPFCYNYDPTNEVGFACLDSILPYVPFSQDLNRYMLTVTNLSGTSANVTWGGVTKSFSSAQLAAGINLAQEFTTTPFDATFAQVMAAALYKEYFENYMIKGTSNYYGNDNGGNVDTNMIAIQAQLDTAVKAMIVPVRHTIIIVPNGSSGPALPVITGTMMAYPTVGSPFSYQITTFKPATRFSALGLPSWLSLNTSTGLITGTPTGTGTTTASISAVNASGTSTTTLALTTQNPIPNYPVITSTATATAEVGVPFSYPIVATNNPTNYFVTVQGNEGTEPPATSLPPGLTYNTTTGLFYGTPTATGTYTNSVNLAAMNAAGVSAQLITLIITGTGGAGAPGAPSGLTATPGNAQVALNWTAGSGATSYNIYRGATSNGESATPYATGVTSTSYTDTGLTNGTSYYYKVAAVNTSGTSGYSNEASGTPASGGGIPPAPTGLTATAGNTAVSLSWTASAGATSYDLYRGTLPGEEGGAPVETGITTTTYTDTNLPNGPTQYYKVTAVDSSGTSGFSNEASATPASTGTGGTVSSVISVVYGSSTAIPSGVSAGFVPETTWNNDPANVPYFGTGSTSLSNLTDSNNSNSGISESLTTYAGYHQGAAVTGFAGAGNNDLYNHGPYTANAPSQGGVLTITGLNASLIYDLYIYVNDPNGASGTLINVTDSRDSQSYYLTTISNASINGFVQGSSTTSGAAAAGDYFELPGLTGASTATATITCASGMCFDGFQLVVHSSSGPATPAGLTAVSGTAVGQIALNWTASTGAQDYLLQRSTSPGGGYSTIATIAAPAVTYTDTSSSLVAGQSYYYEIAAAGTSGTSAFSSYATATPDVPATFGGWVYSYFGLNAPSSETADTADLANDGLSNLLKYALGLDPLVPATFQAALGRSGSAWEYTYQRPASRADITYAVQVSTDLSTWTTTGVTLSETASGNPETWQATYTPATGSKLFFRLQVTGP